MKLFAESYLIKTQEFYEGRHLFIFYALKLRIFGAWGMPIPWAHLLA